MVLPDLEQIRKRRQALGLTQQKLADGAKVLRVVINRIEKRKKIKFRVVKIENRFIC